MRLVEMILSPLENRMLAAYRKKNDLDLQVFIDMSDQQRADLFAKIAKVYPVPQTEPGYFYHGTSKDRLASIRANGLTTDNESRWGKTSIGSAHSKSRIFFSSSFDVAEWYASRWSKSPLYLRVAATDIEHFEHDPEENDSIFVTSSIPASAIQVWSGKGWVGL